MVDTLDKKNQMLQEHTLQSRIAERQQVHLSDNAPNVGRYAGVSNDARRDVSSVNALVNGVFADGIVTDVELETLQSNRDDVMYDFLVAVDVYNDMKKSGMYSQAALDNAHYVMTQLKIARDISYGAMNRASYYNDATPEEGKRREERRQKKETIQLALMPVEIALMAGLADDMIKLAYMEDKGKISMLSPEQYQQREARIQAMVQEADHNRTPSLVLSLYNQRQNA